uniref:Uncharacterized protein n=1 Tax=Anguilla anguilla TaxID=7936 RepID=A0A0E9T6X0_ANGAN
MRLHSFKKSVRSPAECFVRQMENHPGADCGNLH